MYKELTISDHLQANGGAPLVDVRAPKEFAAGHIPGAVNIPLFNDEERALIGTAYKHEGRQVAIRKGLAVTGPKLEQFIELASQVAKGNKLVLHCWRGGMRSQSMATLFDFAGFQVQVIKGGYKSYRRLVHELFMTPMPLFIVGGRTGSGKTSILHALQQLGEQVIDLEGLAHHKGSAFGDLGEPAQPSTEMFENLLFDKLRSFDLKKRIWVEDESHLVGTVFIPEPFWQQMRDATVLFCDVPMEERIRHLIADYGHFEAEALTGAVKKITKRLGGQHAKAAIAFYEAGDLEKATEIVLAYYDKAYAHGLSQRTVTQIHQVKMDKLEPIENAKQLIDHVTVNNINPIYHLPNITAIPS